METASYSIPRFSARGYNPFTLEFEIVLDRALSPRVCRFVVRGFFTPRELPIAIARAFLTWEFAIFVGLPCALLAARHLLPEESGLRPAFTVVALVWLAGGLAWIYARGRNQGIGCHALEEGARGRLAAGLLIKPFRHERTLLLSGVLVDPEFRGKGLFSALLLAAFRLAAEEARAGPLGISAFAPAHPASRHIVEKYLHGRRRLEVDAADGSPFAQSLRKLEDEIRALEARGVRFRYTLAGAPLFPPPG